MPNVLITGANRGLGLEFARQYATDGWRVHACSRSPSTELPQIPGDVHVHALDVADPRAIDDLARELKDEPLDVLVNNAGVYGRHQALGELDAEGWDNVLRVNSIAPILMTQAFLPHLKRAKGAKVAIVTSRMGSIADNTSGGAYVYRSSKAALNAAGRSLALDLKGDGIVVLLLHPGWVRTDMGGSGGNLEPPESVAAMRDGIADAEMRHSGGFYAFDGREIPW